MKQFFTISQVVSLFKAQSLLGQCLRFFYFLFLCFFLRYFELLFYTTSIGSTLFNPLYESLSLFITKSSCFFWRWSYSDIHATANHTILIGDQAPIKMLPGCTGLSHILRLIFVLFLYPMSFKKKGYIFAPTIFIIILASTLHFVILIPIAYHRPELYEFAHNYFTKILFFGLIFICWLMWEKIRSFPKNEV